MASSRNPHRPTHLALSRITSSSSTGFIPTSGGVASADCPSPLRSVLGVLWLHASCAEVFRDAIFPIPLWAASPSSSSLQCLDSPVYITVFPSSTWPSQRSLLSLIFPTNSPTFTLPLMASY